MSRVFKVDSDTVHELALANFELTRKLAYATKEIEHLRDVAGRGIGAIEDAIKTFSTLNGLATADYEEVAWKRLVRLASRIGAARYDFKARKDRVAEALEAAPEPPDAATFEKVAAS